MGSTSAHCLPLSPAAAAVMRPPRRAGFGFAPRVRPQSPLLMLLRWAEALLLLLLLLLLLPIRLLPPRISADVAVVVLRIPPSAALVIGRRRATVMVDVTGIRRTRGGNFRAASLFKCYLYGFKRSLMQCMHIDKRTYSSTWNCDFRPYVNSCDSTWVKGVADHDHRYHGG